MPISTLDISPTTSAVRRHEALLRYARYLLIFNLVIFVVAASKDLAKANSWSELVATVTSPPWGWAALVLGSVGGSYLILAHRLWWVYAAILFAQVGYFFTPSPDKMIFKATLAMVDGVVTQPAMRPLAPLATELAVMTVGFAYVMLVFCLYSLAWIAAARHVPHAAYGTRPSLLGPLRPTELLETKLCGHRSEKVALGEVGLFALSSLAFVAASMSFFYGIRLVQNGFETFAGEVQASCLQAGGAAARSAEATIACMAEPYPWSRALLDLGAPLAIAALSLVIANRLRRSGRRRFLHRLAGRPVSPEGATLFLRAFRDDQVRIRRASRNLFSIIFDLGRSPATLDELMLERLDGRGDLIAIGNPRDKQDAARPSPWGAHRLYVDDARWQETVAMLAAEAERIVLCVDASDGVRWEIAHVLSRGHAGKTLFFVNLELDAEARLRLLAADFGVSPKELASVDVSRILALRQASPGQLTVIVASRPERDAYLVAARLAFDGAERAGPAA